MTTKKRILKKAVAKSTARSRRVPPETAIYGRASDGECFKCDRNEEMRALEAMAWLGILFKHFNLHRGVWILDAGLHALRLVASNLTIAGVHLPYNPWDLVQAFGDAKSRYHSKEVRSLGEAFGMTDWKGRIATYGPRRVIRDGRKVSREEAIVHDLMERVQAKKPRGVAYAEVGALHGIGAEGVRKILKRLAKEARDPGA